MRKKSDDIQTLSSLEEFIQSDKNKFDLDLEKMWESKRSFDFRDWEKWLSPYGAELKYHGEQLDFMMYYKEGKGAILKFRSHCGGNLKWSEDEIVILSRVPPGEPLLIRRKDFSYSEITSFKSMISKYLSVYQIAEWNNFFSGLGDQEDGCVPFVLRYRRAPKEGKMHWPPEPEQNQNSVRIYKSPLLEKRKIQFSYKGKNLSVQRVGDNKCDDDLLVVDDGFDPNVIREGDDVITLNSACEPDPEVEADDFVGHIDVDPTNSGGNEAGWDDDNDDFISETVEAASPTYFVRGKTAKNFYRSLEVLAKQETFEKPKRYIP